MGRLKNSLFVFTVLSLLTCNNLVLAEKINSQTEKKKPVITVRAEVDRDSITIGDKIKYTISVQTKSGIEVEFPSFAQNLAGFAIRDFGSSKTGLLGKKRFCQWYILDTYTTGKYTIPKALIRYREKNQEKWQEIETNEVEVEVKSVLGESDKHLNIRDIKGPVDFPSRIVSYISLTVLILFLLGGAAALFFLKRKKKEVIVPPKPAHQIAYEALEELKRRQLIAQNRIKEYYIELSDIVRHYLENRFNLRAPEMTTEEFLITIKDSKQLSYEHRSLLRDFLSHCDLVKFARYGPTALEIDSSLKSAEKLIDQTKAEREDKAE